MVAHAVAMHYIRVASAAHKPRHAAMSGVGAMPQ